MLRLPFCPLLCFERAHELGQGRQRRRDGKNGGLLQTQRHLLPAQECPAAFPAATRWQEALSATTARYGRSSGHCTDAPKNGETADREKTAEQARKERRKPPHRRLCGQKILMYYSIV